MSEEKAEIKIVSSGHAHLKEWRSYNNGWGVAKQIRRLRRREARKQARKLREQHSEYNAT